MHRAAARAGAAVLLSLCAVASACGGGQSPDPGAQHSSRVGAVVSAASQSHAGPVAVLVVDNRTGEITAAVSAGDTTRTPMDGGTAPAASLAKVPVLAAALESGVAPVEVLDVPQCIRVEERTACTTRPGEVRLGEAVAHSNDPAFIVLTDRTGPEAIVEYGARVGMVLEPSRALPLGLDAVSMESVAALLAAMANDGETLAIIRSDGTEAVGATGRLVSAETAGAVRKLLRMVVTGGTGLAADGIDEPYGKTGTAEGRTDAWFAGVSGEQTIVVWVGSSDGEPADGASATDTQAGILADYEARLRGETPTGQDGHRLTGGGLPAQVFRQVADLFATPVENG